MKKIIERNRYLQRLTDREENGLIKVVTGIRRCGKSYLLFNLFYNHLLESGVDENRIIAVALDDDENAKYRDPYLLSDYIRSRITDKNLTYYILLDEVQLAISREEMKNKETIRLYDVLNGLMRLGNTDIYVTGSNSKMLSKDVMTAFRGRGDTVEVYPLSFKEYYDFVGGDKSDAYEEYALYGGMPLVLSKKTDADKSRYLASLFDEVYFKDITERYRIAYPDVLAELTDDLCSSIGSLTNASKITNTIHTVKGLNVDDNTVAGYLDYLSDSFLFRQAKRYDVKGKKYFLYPSKYYCADIGLRNVRLNFRQQEETHIMENIIYNELVSRGYMVDVGVVDIYITDEDGKYRKSGCEIDFVANLGAKKYYIQSALNISEAEKEKSEMRPFLAVRDNFRKIIITKTNMKPWTDDNGIIHIGLYDFLLNESAIDY